MEYKDKQLLVHLYIVYNETTTYILRNLRNSVSASAKNSRIETSAMSHALLMKRAEEINISACTQNASIFFLLFFLMFFVFQLEPIWMYEFIFIDRLSVWYLEGTLKMSDPYHNCTWEFLTKCHQIPKTLSSNSLSLI